MFVRHLSATAAATLLGGLWLDTPAYAASQPVAAGYTMSSGRAGSIVAVLLGLAGIIIGGMARARSTRRAGDGRRGALTALALGLIGLLIGAVVAATSGGRVGTGNGLAGAVLGMALGLTSALLGGLTVNRSRRTG